MAEGVNTAVKATQPTVSDPVPHATFAHTERSELRSCDQPPLPLRELG
jgi:hypothetical protein